jgi:hypothetical protein
LLSEEPRKFRLRPRHAFLLVDLVVMAAIFYATGNVYMKMKGVDKIEKKRQERVLAQQEGARLIEQADSVVTATGVRLQEVTEDSTASLQELSRMRAEYEAQVQDAAALEQGIYRLSDVVLDMRSQADLATRDARQKEADVAGRQKEVDSLRATESQRRQEMTETQRAQETATQRLLAAQQKQAYDPKGMLPERTGLMVRRDVSSDNDLTNLLLQQTLWNPGELDVGLSLGFGLGSRDATSQKEVGLLMTRNLIHRRLGLDVGAGYSVLTEEGGTDENSPYASASLRLSPFYKERLHLGLGARANRDEVVPFLGVTLGRR